MSNNKTAECLKQVLADTYTLYLKTQNYHWNVTGPQFHSLHVMFEEQYTDYAMAVDEIAERIRAIGHKAPGSYAAYTKMTNISEADESLDGKGMVKDLHASQQALIKSLNAARAAAEEEGDEVSVDLTIQRLTTHEKFAWMLSASV